MTTLQKILVTATIAAAVVTPVAIQHQAQVKLRDEITTLRQQIILSLLVDQGGGRSEMPKMKVQRIGDEWMMAGPYRPPHPEEQ